MLDLKWILANKDKFAECLKNRNFDFDLNILENLDLERRKIIGQTEELKAKRNEGSRKVGAAKRAGEDASELSAEIKLMGDEIKALDEKLAGIETKLHDYLMAIPNKLSDTTPVGKDETENVVVRTWGTPKDFAFEPKPHWDLAEDLDIINFDKGVMLAQSRFAVLKGMGAKLERALVSFMLD
ncbi:MAG: serine--tRNA ligase, partial [Synergistaceae bacterium]|nr:serine--tRNA ligase [Synergistaceae bacterium]